MRLLVDGMNVIGSRPDGWWKDRDGAMARLVEELERLAEASGDEITVVFEREPRPPIVSELVEVAHAPESRPDAADDEIVRLLKADAAPESIIVATSDRRLAGRAGAIGATVEGAGSLRRRISAAGD